MGKPVGNTIQRAAMVVEGCGTDKSVPYAHVETHAIHHNVKFQFAVLFRLFPEVPEELRQLFRGVLIYLVAGVREDHQGAAGKLLG